MIERLMILFRLAARPRSFIQTNFQAHHRRHSTWQARKRIFSERRMICDDAETTSLLGKDHKSCFLRLGVAAQRRTTQKDIQMPMLKVLEISWSCQGAFLAITWQSRSATRVGRAREPYWGKGFVVQSRVIKISISRPLGGLKISPFCVASVNVIWMSSVHLASQLKKLSIYFPRPISRSRNCKIPPHPVLLSIHVSDARNLIANQDRENLETESPAPSISIANRNFGGQTHGRELCRFCPSLFCFRSCARFRVLLVETSVVWESSLTWCDVPRDDPPRDFFHIWSVRLVLRRVAELSRFVWPREYIFPQDMLPTLGQCLYSHYWLEYPCTDSDVYLF